MTTQGIGRRISHLSRMGQILVYALAGVMSMIGTLDAQSLLSDEANFTPSPDPRRDYLRGRLIIFPTAQSLPAGTAYFSDAWFFFPSLTVGFFDEFSMTAGMSVFPGLGVSEQLMYFAPRLSFPIVQDIRVGGSVFTTMFDDERYGVATSVITVGGSSANFTVGIGYGYSRTNGGHTEWSDLPVLALGIYSQTSDHSAVVIESWSVPHRDFEPKDILMGAAVRFFGDNLLTEVGGFFRPLPQEGNAFLFPFLNASYRFSDGD